MSELRNIVMKIAKKNIVIRKILRYGNYYIKSLIYKIESTGKKVDENVIIFSCFKGQSYCCTPKAIYEYMVNKEEYKNFKYVWFFKEPENYKFLQENLNTKVFKYGKKEYKKYLHIAKYWFFNFKIADFIKPNKSQIFIQCWHGTPLKKLGCDLINLDNELNTVNEMKKRYKKEAKKFSYFISPSKYASEKFISAWNLKDIKKENIIIEEGYPRNDYLFNYRKEDIIKIKNEILGNNINKKIILYAPTYRANQHQTGIGYVYKEEINFEKMQKELGEDYIVLFRPHYFIANQFDFNKYKGFVYDVSKIDDINELYIISDILITDYSSVFFDYANLKRPIIFYMYDLEYYRDESNGFYFNIEDELPGVIVKKEEEVFKEIRRIDKQFLYDEKYRKFNEKYNYLDDGKASERVVNKVIKV